MKHLFKFNELKSSTYVSASKSLRQLGHTKRADDLLNWSREVSNRQLIESWEKEISNVNSPTINIGKINIGGKSKFNYTIEDIDFKYHVEFIIEDVESFYTDTHLSIPFNFCLIPVDIEGLNKIIEVDNIYKRETGSESNIINRYGSDYPIILYLDITYDIKDGNAEFTGIKAYCDEYDRIKLEFQSRRSVGILRSELVKFFDPFGDSKSNEYGIRDFDYVNGVIFGDSGLDDYDLDMEVIFKDIKSASLRHIL
jgi:hypothetical protein